MNPTIVNIQAYSYDVRSYDPELFAKLIMWWCFRGTGIPKEMRWHHCAGRLIITWSDGTITDFVYHAQEKYEKITYAEWIKKYQIINYCKTSDKYSQEQLLKVYQNYESFVDKPYGKPSIVGLVIKGLTGFVTIGVDGSKKLICSESEIRAHADCLTIPEGTIIDYYDVRQRGEFFDMRSYIGDSKKLKNFYKRGGK